MASILSDSSLSDVGSPEVPTVAEQITSSDLLGNLKDEQESREGPQSSQSLTDESESPQRSKDADQLRSLEGVESTNSEIEKAAATKVRKEEAKKLREQLKQEQKLQKELKKEQERKDKELKKEQERREKEQRKLEEKKRKEEEKKERERRREEEKRSRELKREQEKREREVRREEEKRRKLVEKLKIEEEKRKKEEAIEKSQTRIGSFFKKSSTHKNVVSTKTDFEKSFLPFYIKDGTIMGENFKSSPKDLERSKAEIDAQMKLSSNEDDTIKWLESCRVSRGHPVMKSAVELIQMMTSKNKTNKELEQHLQQIPHKFIKFYENVRPPYIGTYSKFVDMPRDNPFTIELTGFDYDYDSDWDWVDEEEEEGGGVDDLEDGDEEEDDDDEPEEGTDGEFEGFLDREDSQGPRDGKKFLGPLIPTIKLRSQISELDEDDQLYFQMVAVEYLIKEQPFPVDPAHYPVASSKRSLVEASLPTKGSKDSPTDDGTSDARSKKPKTLVTEPVDLLRLFNEVHESTFSLGTITEILQKNLPHYSKETIRNTIKEHTTRPATKAGGSRKWVLKNLDHWEALKRSHGSFSAN
ncbi:Rlf2p [Lachancea thermotolerans CBS 6340]|uniref:KLTH0H08712p n=1 Tax=Lachancea thermotolerans (strain ATCC 56472 / CBS 6340 / NRRL Y-8284) TaxID=559295 RepID=C5E2Y0_LACTC|nr:KLTH0H08712p [Lachancea thermotolerans CBS 6340]CAR30391.1 KLTH0H08712p [Lachancea thermotolerans CBS 6340]